jgi:hypothetical protein
MIVPKAKEIAIRHVVHFHGKGFERGEGKVVEDMIMAATSRN